MTLFDVFSKREAGDAGLPQQASDAELLAWSEQIRTAAHQPDDDVVIDLRLPQPKHAARRPLRAQPLVAAPEVLQPSAPSRPAEVPAARRRAPLRARPLVAPPAAWVDR